MKFYITTVVAMLFGVSVHIAKKAMQEFQKDSTFSLWDYLLGHPYQTFLTFAAGAGGYLGLLSGDALTLSSAFLAGVAANSLADIAPGNR